MSKISGIERSSIFDAGQHGGARGRQIVVGTDADGQPIIERVPWIPYRLMVDANGHVRRLTLTNGASLRDVETDAYGLHQVAAKHAAGWIEFSRCPLSNPGTREQVPAKLRADPVCDMSKRPARECCKHVQAVIDARRQRHERIEADYARRYARGQHARDLSESSVIHKAPPQRE